MIMIKGLYKSFENEGQEVEVLKNVNLTIEDGDIFGIIGPSGAGKSTLIRCFNLLEKPNKGEIIVDGVNITKLNGKKLRDFRKNMGMIFQHFNLLQNSTVYKNIAFPLEISGYSKDFIEQRVLELLDMVNLKDKKDAYPSMLSGGQKQRVAIARALALNPKYILSDEATSALDPLTTRSISDLLKFFNKKYGITIILITHEMDVVKEICNKVAFINNGRIIEWGNTYDLLNFPKSIEIKQFVNENNFKIDKEELFKNVS
ncbi:methionine ABC transporter ATP-binding protein [Caloramator australicus]|uniref:Methionine ABC transporter ATP-binding protein n=1 Tax=Caloramator australicus RC3 TaxID=857293 RepID=I7LKD4_9CLOT|nr:ATP-binding cassette domain-containing protein [Caloramator australicus]CCJ34348.1 Methionine ABC transporter ATP-binding protein [Caloramator australicus RC3]